MEKAHASFGAAIPAHYEQYLVPLIFADYALALAKSLVVAEDAHVLETACGTGIVTRHIAEQLGDRARFTATDLNEPMLKEARTTLGDGANVEFQFADAQNLPFDADAFDAVLSQFGVMFFPDRMQGYREAVRVLKPGGQFLFNVWDGLENNLFVQTIAQAVGSLYPDDPPKFYETPYGYHDLELIVRELQQAGFAHVDISVIPLMSEAPTPRHVALGYVAGTPLANTIAERQTHTLEEVIDCAEKAVQEKFGSGPCSARMQAFQITAFLP
jgi:ubiquinone/menaquinone biosynthesis C-methylase UbiE